MAEDISKYEHVYDLGWDHLRSERYERMLELGVIDESYSLSPRSSGLTSWQEMMDNNDWSLRMAVYAAMVDRMDQGIGRVMDQLHAMDAMNQTLILFLSDNGGSSESVESRQLHDPETIVGERGSYLAYQEAWANASNTPFRLYKQ